MVTRLRELGLTPGLERILVDAGLDNVEAALEAQEHLSDLPGMTEKRLQTVTNALNLHRAHMADIARKSFIADRRAQADRIQSALQFLKRMESNDDSSGIQEAIEALTEAKRYADLMANERHVDNVCIWLQYQKNPFQ